MFEYLSRILLLSLMLHWTISNQFTFGSFKFNPQKDKREPVHESDKKMKIVNDSPVIDPMILELRKSLYLDTSLKEYPEQIPEFYKTKAKDKAELEESVRAHPKEWQTPEKRQELENLRVDLEVYWPISDAVLLIRKGQSKQAVSLLESDAKKGLKEKDYWDYWLVLAYSKQQAGDIIGARRSVREILKLPGIEGRELLRTWRILRELGEKIDDAMANEVQGVVVEIGINNTVVFVAGFANGESRLLIGTGYSSPIAVKEYYPEDTRTSAKELVHSAEPFAGKLPLENKRELPKQGKAKFVLMTVGGTYVTEESIDHLENGKSELSTLWEATNLLFSDLIDFMKKK
jgi:hypothetical protein